ncbi:MAG TPA: hypothetical protein DIW82_08220 [Corynebacterium nuruki]|uniref:Uncharacterized protein n=1 Tax=Corynebacterium nuruki TaxID=1032851 RepID=A0A3D4T0G1_9CORY|nr:hypothetical protein [Corynebacterium nuruki]
MPHRRAVRCTAGRRAGPVPRRLRHRASRRPVSTPWRAPSDGAPPPSPTSAPPRKSALFPVLS